ncbi:Mycolic acid cyclopropane synthetase-domain-containing protein [Paraphysoderma sedebokerense]|nr:Mycolic acid cyclopropane synthetase-domain-containing protein [Paraphysoderma sedebokerense]
MDAPSLAMPFPSPKKKGRFVFTSMLKNIKHGNLTLIFPDKTTLHFPETAANLQSSSNYSSDNEDTAKPERKVPDNASGFPTYQYEKQLGTVYHNLNATVRILDDHFWFRLISAGDMGFAEAFIAGEVEVDDMMAFLIIMVRNRPYLNNFSAPTAALASTVDYLSHTRLANTIKNSMNNISAHYDLSNDLFSCFLDKSMMYSCAVWDWESAESLEDAQMRKIHEMIRKAALRKGEFVLEIGTGWGGFAIEAVRQTQCYIHTVTLSIEQKELAEQRILDAERSGIIPKGHIKVILTDYRKLPELYDDETFDKIVSIEMIEAVGKEFLDTYFEVCNKLLKQNGGIMVFQAITIPETRFEQYSRSCDFIQKHIFPGGFLPTVSSLTAAVEKGSKSQLIIDHVQNYGSHYAKTLQVWKQRFLENWEYLKKTESLAERSFAESAQTANEGLKRRRQIYTEEFKRKWCYYLDYCAAGFATKTLGVYQIVLAREGTEQLLEGPYRLGSLEVAEERPRQQ